MNFSGFLRQLKKRLRHKKGWLSLAVIVLAAASTTWIYLAADAENIPVAVQTQTRNETTISLYPEIKEAFPSIVEILESLSSNGSHEVYLQQTYLCGQETNRMGQLNAEEIARFAEEHPLAKPSIRTDNSLLFEELMEDLSAQCKENAYFGVDKEGNLSLFDAIPDEERVIKTFFQLNVDYLKSSLPEETWKQLYAGIRVHDVNEYNSIIASYGDFSAARQGGSLVGE